MTVRTQNPAASKRAAGRPRREQSEDLSRLIVQSAMDLFYRKGFAATSMEDIASACRTTRRSISHRFPQKHDLLLAAARLHGEEVSTGLRKLVRAPGLPGLERLRQALRFLFGLAISGRSSNSIVVFAYESSHCPPLAQRLTADEVAWEDELEAAVKDAQAAGAFARFISRDVAAAAVAMMLSYPGILSLLHSDQVLAEPAEAYFERMWRLILTMADIESPMAKSPDATVGRSDLLGRAE